MLTTAEVINESSQSTRLRELLPGWIERVPLYQQPAYQTWAKNETAEPTDLLKQLPFITKRDLRRQFPNNFLGPDADLEKLIEQNLVELEHTSGTVEEQTSLLLARGWWPIQEKWALRRNPFVAQVLDEIPGARRLTINSPLCGSEINYSSVPSRLERTIGNNLSASLSRHPFLWDEVELARIAEEAIEWQPVFLDVDPVYGVVFAQYCERHGIRLPSLRFIICSYEFVSVVHRRILQRVFGVPVLNLYGSTETGHLLMENEQGEMVPSLETAFLEVVEPDANNVGELIVTTLTNYYMPLIRYHIGDLVEEREEPYHTTYVVHGRRADAFIRPSGRVTVLQVDECFAGISGIAHYQLVEQEEGSWLLRFVADGDDPTTEEITALREKITERLEITASLEIEPTEILLAEGSGKFRLSYPLRASTK